jgi:hypothetical protein
MTNQTIHKYQVTNWYTLPFSECVAPNHCVPKAHGNVTDIITCSCQATQRTNVNRVHREIGPWIDMIPDEEV